jgi:hypothetical protein
MKFLESYATGQIATMLVGNYTVAELEVAGLWTNMDAKLAALGGCAQLA